MTLDAVRRPGRAAVLTPGRRRGLRIAVLLAPALTVIGVVFLGGFVAAVAQSLGYQPFLPTSRWTVSAYAGLWADPAVRASIGLTLRVTVLATALALVLGVAAALLIRGLDHRGRVLALFQLNLAVPHVVGALCMVLLLSQSGLISRVTHAVGLTDDPAAFPGIIGDEFGWGIVAEYVWKETPFIGVIALSAMQGGVTALEQAARVLGAGTWQRLWRVTLPIITPPVLAGSILVLTFSLGSYEVGFLLGRPYPATLPVVAYQYFRDSDLTYRPVAMAISVVLTVVSAVLVAGYLSLAGRLAGRRL